MGELGSVVTTLRAEVLTELSDAEVEERFAELHRAHEQLEAEVARSLLDLERRGICEREGHLSSASWYVARCGTSVSAARTAVRLGRAFAAMPVTARAVDDGQVAMSAAKVLVQAHRDDPEAFARSEELLVQAARTHPLAELARVVALWRERVQAERIPEARDRVLTRRRLHASVTLAGMVRVDGDLDPETGESLLTALASVLDAESRTGAHDRRTPAQRRADALGEICRRHLDRSDRPEVAGERPHMTLTVAAAALSGDSVVGQLDHVGSVGASTVRALACDASVTRVVLSGTSQPLDVGRATPVVPAAMRRAAIVRDRGCRFPGCDRPHRWCDAHHVVHWADGGPTAIDNLLLLCRRHHRLVHTRYALELVEGRTVFRRPDGSVLVDEPLAVARGPG
ncbi:MAG: DUF222 domain-containing protein [Actinomycetota bacterium]